MSAIKTGIFLPTGQEWQPSRQELKFLRDRGLVVTRKDRQGVARPELDLDELTSRLTLLLRAAYVSDEAEIADVGLSASQIIQHHFGVTVDDVSEECLAWLEKVVKKQLSSSMMGAVNKALAPELDDDPRVMLVSKNVRRNRRGEDGSLLLELDNTKVLVYAVTDNVDIIDALVLNPLRETRIKTAARDAGRAAAMTARLPELAPHLIADSLHAIAIAASNADQIKARVLADLSPDQQLAVLARADAIVAERRALSTGNGE